MTKEFRYCSYLKLDSLVVTCAMYDAAPESSPQLYHISYLAGDYFQALRHIIAPAEPMVQQQISLIITLAGMRV